MSLPTALLRGYELIRQGCRDAGEVRAVMYRTMQSEPGVEPDYAEILDESLRSPEVLAGELRLLVAARVGLPRLIDNMGVTI